MEQHKCIIICPLYTGEDPEFLRREEGDLFLCADGGYAACRALALQPDLVIGDFDSMPSAVRIDCERITLPVLKDDTDLAVCIRYGREHGYGKFVIGGAIGGRLDHTLAALQCLTDCAKRGEEAWLCDAGNRVRALAPGEYTVPKADTQGRKLSILSMTDRAEGVTLRGTRWELTDAALTNDCPLGVSNEALDDVHLSFRTGILLLGLCEDKAAAAPR